VEEKIWKILTSEVGEDSGISREELTNGTLDNVLIPIPSHIGKSSSSYRPGGGGDGFRILVPNMNQMDDIFPGLKDKISDFAEHMRDSSSSSQSKSRRRKMGGDRKEENSGGDGSQGKEEVDVEKVTVSEARLRFSLEVEEDLMKDVDVTEQAIQTAEENGIIFIDEIDKLCGRGAGDSNVFERKGEGVQKELLGLLEGSEVHTKYGIVKTHHILFLCSGSFHQSSPSDLMPELQVVVIYLIFC